MEELISLFDERLRLTEKQEEDAKIKYSWVCETIHKYYYPNKIYDWSTKYLFGSYKKKTNIRPISESQDVDVLFKMPQEEFDRYNNYWEESNWQSALLQKIRDILKDTYTTTDIVKAWWKVILIKFSNGKHNVEVLPARENEDGSFKIPNTENWWRRETFNPREDIKIFKDSNADSLWLTAILSRFLKSWKRENKTFIIKSYQLEEYVISYLNNNTDKKELNLNLIIDLFSYIKNSIDSKSVSFIETAYDRLKKAEDFEKQKKYESVVEQLKKVFWDKFPSISSINKTRTLTKFVLNEEYIEDIYSLGLNSSCFVKIDCEVEQDWFRKYLISDYIEKWFPLWMKKKT